MEYFLLFLSIPFFYIWGLVSFIKFLFRRHGKPTNVDRKLDLPSLIAELKKFPVDKQVGSLIKEYEEELQAAPATQPPVQDRETTKPEAASEPKTKHTDNPTPSFQNWYKDNSINLLLYIGAFLIVMSASIYVGLDAVTGISKGFVLTFTTLLFFISGLWFSTMPKVKNAGSAFTGIGALLIPISGLGWYNFVFKTTDVSMGTVWLVTSLVGLLAYIFLARFFKSVFYSYVSSFSTLSFSFAFINMQGLQNDFYILASIMSSIILLGVSIYFDENKTKDTELFAQPFNITANIVMPLSIFYAMFLLSDGPAFTLQSTVSVFMGCVFYIICYLYYKKPWHVLAAQVLFSIGLAYFGSWQQLGTVNTLYVITASAYLDIYLIYFFNKHHRTEDANFSTILSIVKTSFIFLYASSSNLTPSLLLVFAIMPIITGILITRITRNLYYMSFSVVFLAIALEIGIQEVLQLSDKSYILGMIYALCAVSGYIVSLMYKTHPRAIRVFGLASGAYFMLSTFIIGDSWGYQLANTLTIALVCFSAYVSFAKKEFIYIGSTILAFSVWCFSEFFRLNDMLYITSMLYSIIGVCWYWAAVHYKKHEHLPQSFGAATIINLLLSLWLIYSVNFIIYQLIVTITIAVVLFSAAGEFKKKQLLYLSNAFIALSVATFLRFIHAPIENYPLSFIALAYAYYLISHLSMSDQKEVYKKSALLGSMGTVIFYGLSSQGNYNSTVEANALISAYATFVLYGFDAYSSKSSRQGYITSVIGLLTYLWQINYLGITASQPYTLAIGAYFFGLSYLQRKAHDQSRKKLFDNLSLFFLLVPTWLESFGADGLFHAITLGMIGITILAFGITYTDRLYRYAGIAAIVLAVTSQSKWAIIGIAGLGFLGLALYLLIFRKEDK